MAGATIDNCSSADADIETVFPETASISMEGYYLSGQANHFQVKDRKGGGTLHQFAVSDGANAFQLTYNSEILNWKVEAVDLGE